MWFPDAGVRWVSVWMLRDARNVVVCGGGVKLQEKVKNGGSEGLGFVAAYLIMFRLTRMAMILPSGVRPGGQLPRRDTVVVEGEW